MAPSQKLLEAFRYFDGVNGKDPNTEVFEGKTHPKELLYAQRMTDTLDAFDPEASEALQLAARCQHIQRWEIPRESFEKGRVGYLQWRQELKIFHAKKAKEILESLGFENMLIERVKSLVQKKKLKKDNESQTLEDVVCLVFLKFYFEPFAGKHPKEKVVDILQKTWKKMSPKGQEAALELSLTEEAQTLIKKALTDGAE
ncbi:DUF4202 domain-containing protein [Flagellimonas myxillae]|uniref:DUF4202 domain-containing protein n=1 Tax=Flagellimonas myxillae TaxID=2942214 RepID=UPI00201F5FEC|nr:DUF4202 domain-containing protein [Muricauda myxillae]MCL6267070.1 DUF4202 domain-containing protein [Muricauda myxillae]